MSHEREAADKHSAVTSSLFLDAPRWLFVQAFISKRWFVVFINFTSMGFPPSMFLLNLLSHTVGLSKVEEAYLWDDLQLNGLCCVVITLQTA